MDNELPTFMAILAAVVIVVGVIIAMSAVTWAFLGASL